MSIESDNSNNQWHIAVLVPARDEEQLIARCLTSVLFAADALPASVTWDVVVVSDCSTDRTLDIAKELLGQSGIAVPSTAGVVGTARAIAANLGLKRFVGPIERCWLANTDADCFVHEDWLLRQLSIANDGFAAVAGIVDVDSFVEHPPHVSRSFRSSYVLHSDGTHPHVHGANFGIRADVYRNVGGWHSLSTAEDHDLCGRTKRSGERLLADAGLCVVTSGRRVGRAPSGFAGALNAHDTEADPHSLNGKDDIETLGGTAYGPVDKSVTLDDVSRP